MADSNSFRSCGMIVHIGHVSPEVTSDKPSVSARSHHGLMPRRNGIGIDLLADPTRRAIVALIALGVGQPSRIAKEIGRSRPATSRQLRILCQAGLIFARDHWSDGRRVVYFIDARRLGQITAWLAGTEVGRAFPPTARAYIPNPHDSVAWLEPFQSGAKEDEEATSDELADKRKPAELSSGRHAIRRGGRGQPAAAWTSRKQSEQ
jgi:hypothetical protein